MTSGVGPVVSRHHGLLGTVIELRVWATDESTAVDVEERALHEIERLQAIFDVHDAQSELRRWLDGRADPSAELQEVLALAEVWRSRSRGAFDPAVGSLVAVWDAAARAGVAPSSEVLERTVRAMRDPGCVESRPSNLNALAKGWIVDRCVDVALSVAGASGITVNAGGDLAHRGPSELVVGIEDPARPYDNEPAAVRIALAGGALATSGGSRRGWRIGDRWFSHVLDPRTGEPVDHVASASVLAGDAATADAVATVLTVVPPEEGLEFVAGVPNAACCIFCRDGRIIRDPRWEAHEIPST